MVEREVYLVCDFCFETYRPENRGQAMTHNARDLRRLAKLHDWAYLRDRHGNLVDMCDNCEKDELLSKAPQ